MPRVVALIPVALSNRNVYWSGFAHLYSRRLSCPDWRYRSRPILAGDQNSAGATRIPMNSYRSFLTVLLVGVIVSFACRQNPTAPDDPDSHSDAEAPVGGNQLDLSREAQKTIGLIVGPVKRMFRAPSSRFPAVRCSTCRRHWTVSSNGLCGRKVKWFGPANRYLNVAGRHVPVAVCHVPIREFCNTGHARSAHGVHRIGAALVLTGQTLTIAAMVGFISLCGIAVRN